MVQTYALPVGDPRTPDVEALSKMEIPVQQGVHELAVHAFMGASKIDYPDVGGTLFSPGFGAAFSYNFFFLPRWSFLVGGGIHLFNNRGTEVEPNFSSDENGPVFGDDINDLADGGKDPVYLYYDFRDYSETQWALMLTVPIMLQYQTNENRNRAFYYAMGLKLGIPFAGTYEGKTSQGRVCGYYPSIWGEPREGMKFDECNRDYFGEGKGENLGFGDFGSVTSNPRLKLGTAFFAALEAGIKWRLYNKLAVYTGVWLDYGLNDVAISAMSKHPFTWTPTKERDEGTPGANIEFKSRTTGQAIPMALGFTVRFAFGGGTRTVIDSTHWIQEIAEKDSLLLLCQEKNTKLEADNARASDSITYLNNWADALMDSLLNCHSQCKQNLDREALRRQMDSLAREAETKRLADLERARLAALERARLDSIEMANQAKKDREMRIAALRKRFADASGDADSYGITQTTPSDAVKKKLDLTAELMTDYKDLRLHIIGHTCDKGTHEANVRFGLQRATSAKSYLVGKGIDPSHITISSKAEQEPIVPNISEENRRKNRRVQIIILEDAQNIEKEAR
jgi:outer membrane protein OmpA-like peptidoglycan-associated protein